MGGRLRAIVRRLVTTLAAALVIGAGGLAAASAAQSVHWIASWATAEQTPEPRNALADAALTNATLRQTAHVSLGGRRWRLRLSNAFGHAPLSIGAAHVALAMAPGSAAIDAATDVRVTFDGREDLTVPAGADYLSDPFQLDAAPGANVAISIYLPAAPDGQTAHPGSRTTSYVAQGDQIAARELAGAQGVEHWFTIAALEVEAAPDAAAIIILGDSIADGRGTTTNGNDRWSDALAARVARAGLPLGVLNFGIGGNRILDDGLGPSALARFDRDVLAPAGVRYLIVHEGINDLGTYGNDATHSDAGHEQLVARLIGAYRQMIERAHARGMTVIGATLTPFDGPTYHPTARGEADRAELNAWIRAPGHFDAVVDFDQAVRDPARPSHLRSDFDSGDGLHPSPRGYQAMAEAIPLSLFAGAAHAGDHHSEKKR